MQDSIMMGEGVSSGRERAIETLVDSEPSGAHYRASRILDEIVPYALLNRPNLITRSALVEQAHALAEYEIDSSEKYRDAFGDGHRPTTNSESSPPDPTLRERVLRHHSKIVTVKSQKRVAAPPPLLLSTLRRLFGSDKVAANHKAFDEVVEPDEKPLPNLEAILGNVLENDQNDLEGLLLAALSVLTGCFLEEEEHEPHELNKGKSMDRASGESNEERRHRRRRIDPTDIPALQVGALVSLLHGVSGEGPFALNDEILNYLQQAASVYEERIEIQKARLLARMQQDRSESPIPIIPLAPTEEEEDDNDDEEDKDVAVLEAGVAGSQEEADQVVDGNPVLENDADAVDVVRESEDDNDDEEDDNDEIAESDNEEEQDGAGSENDVDEDEDAEEQVDEEVEDDDDEDDDENNDDLAMAGDSAALMNTAVFDQMISAVAGDDESLDEVDRAALRLAAGGLGQDSSDSESSNERDSDRYEEAPHAQDSSSSDGEEMNNVNENDEDDDDEEEDNEEEEENDPVLRRALALSLAEQKDPEKEGDVEEGDPVSVDAEASNSPGNVSHWSEEGVPLPVMPRPPAHYPYWSSMETVTDFDERKDVEDKLNPCLDPTSLARFGSIPASFAIVRLLHGALTKVADSCDTMGKNVRDISRQEFKGHTVPGGMGSALFGSESHTFPTTDDNEKDEDKEAYSHTSKIQLLTMALIMFFDSRKDAIEGLRQSVLAEQRNAQDEGELEDEEEEENNRDSNDTPLSDDEDEDNTMALAMTLNYTEDNELAASLRSSSSQTESLENKGMKRKAAAAGYDAAMRIKSLRKKTDAWKDRVKLYSYCTLLVMRCFRVHSQNCIAKELDTRKFSDQNSSLCFAKRLSEALPDAVGSKLSEVMSELLSVSEFRSLPTLVSGDDAGEVEELFMPLALYREALVAWGEYVPLMYQSPSDREEILRNLIEACFSKASNLHHLGSFDTLFSLPSTEDESLLYKLDVLCRRLCVSDILDKIVSRPLCFNPVPSRFGLAKDDSLEFAERTLPLKTSMLLGLLYSSSIKTSGACLRFLRRLNMALCHRCTVRGILWDGLYASLDVDAGESVSSPSSAGGVDHIRVSQNPSPALQFDSARCSDSIAILSNHSESPSGSNGSSVHQRASKVWGAVLSSSFFNPRSGVHRWAVRLDRCERGHVFVGVATAQAGMRTYVGGDKYGWGVIGTQALWHDRRKIRGDYGATFRTGSVIVVTLDTDAGTLSFSSWKEVGASSSSFSIDPLFPASPRRSAGVGGALEEWGVAFEGLPLDAKLYPAVGLYQRDDRVTLLPVESGARSTASNIIIDGELFSGGMGYFPRPRLSPTPGSEGLEAEMSAVREHNSSLSWDAIEFVELILRSVIQSIKSEDAAQRDLALHTILPSVAASICLLPNSIPILSARFAVQLLPVVKDCIDILRSIVQQEEKLFNGMLKEGKWVIRATGSGSTSNAGGAEFEEYVVNFSNKGSSDGGCLGFHGTGVGTTGKSKNGLVSIIGAVSGSCIHFVEEWMDGVEEGTCESDETASSCAVSGRMSLDGFRFEGTYRNIQYGTTGLIAGICISATKTESSNSNALRCECLLRVAHGHLVSVIGNDTAGDHMLRSLSSADKGRKAQLLSFVSSSVLRSGLNDEKGAQLSVALRSLRATYDGETLSSHLLRSEFFLVDDVLSQDGPPLSVAAFVEANDEVLSTKNGGKGSLSALSPDIFSAAKRKVITALIHHCVPDEKLSSPLEDDLDRIWRTGLTIIEGQVRDALSSASIEASGSSKNSCSRRCHDLITASDFLLSIEPNHEEPTLLANKLSILTSFYVVVRSEADFALLRDEFDASSRRACLKYIAVKHLEGIIPLNDGFSSLASLVAVESSVATLPRLLGRGLAPKLPLPNAASLDVAHHFLAAVPGAGRLLQGKIQRSCHTLVRNMGMVMLEINRLEASDEVSSFLLAMLPVFASSIRPDDIEDFTLRSQVFETLSKILSSHRRAFRVKRHDISHKEASKSILLAEMNEVISRDLSRRLMHVATSVSHTILYQLTHWTVHLKSTLDCRTEPATMALEKCVMLVMEELKGVLPFILKALQEDAGSFQSRQEKELYVRWLGVSVPDALEGISKRRSGKIRRPGLSYIIERGTFSLQPPSSSSPTKLGRKHSSSTGTLSTENPQKRERIGYDDGIAYRGHITRCLDMMHCVARSKEACEIVVQGNGCVDVMFELAGISIQYGLHGETTGAVVAVNKPQVLARYRARVLRFLLAILRLTAANEHFLEGLFMLIGYAVNVEVNSLFGNETLVASEGIAALRALYTPSYPDWCGLIDGFITHNLPTRDELENPNLVTLGILSFVSGSLRTLGPGCYVLLKPAAAAPLSGDSQLAPSSKSHGSSGSGGAYISGITSHHVVGNGTEGIVAGLCRFNAGAGVVSSVDLKTGMCEVILVERELEDTLSHNDLLRNNLTVRALRSPLSEVAQAEVMPLILGPSFPVVGFLSHSLLFGLSTFVKNAVEDATTSQEIKSRGARVHVSLLVFRSAIVLLSDKRLMDEFKMHEGFQNLVSTVLTLAAGEQGFPSKVVEYVKGESLAALPIHEGRYHLFVCSLSELWLRQSYLALAPPLTWSKRAEDLRSYRKNEKEWTATSQRSSGGADTPDDTSMGQSGKSGQDAARPDTTPSNRNVSQSSVSTSGTEDEDESEAAATAAAHLREAAIAQMAELGLPRSWSELALRRTGGTNIEAAVHFCLERGADMERLLAEERERERMMQRQPSGSRRRGIRGEGASGNHLLRQLLEMGFPSRWCAEALAATRNNVDEALTWILTNGERLSAQDEGMEEDEEADGDFDEEEEEDDEDDEDDEAETDPSHPFDELTGRQTAAEESKVSTERVESGERDLGSEDKVKREGKSWCGSVTPLRFISGRSLINPKTLSISGLPTGGFSSVGTKGVLLTAGKWYYEAILETAGCLQIGWADGSFSGHCNADRGDGCGDGPSSWAYDGWRRYRWHSTATEWGCRWKEGDIIGCMVDMDARVVSFTLNGKGEEIGMGVAFSGQGFRPCGGVYACVSFNRKEKLRLILGGEGNEPFKYSPPEGYHGVGEAVLAAVKERETLLENEKILSPKEESSSGDTELARFLCDFSDGEHGHELFAWQHRYYGSDASVHLGSKQSGSGKGPGGSEASAVACALRCLEKEWSGKTPDIQDLIENEDHSSILIAEGFEKVEKQFATESFIEGLTLGILYSRKLILHLVVTFGDSFHLGGCMISDEPDTARSFWHVIDSCVSLRSAGWVGEAGAMAIAAEALGLGISSTEHQARSLVSDRTGLTSIIVGEDTVLLPVAGISQLLSAISNDSRSTSRSLAACCEASIGSDGGGGPLIFLQRGLQSAARGSESLRQVLVAVIRRAVRQLAVVEYSGDDASVFDSNDDDIDGSSKREETTTTRTDQPDARLTCFLTGLLLSSQVRAGDPNKGYIYHDLLQAWSVGLLSASAPWRMVCALTASGILNQRPETLSEAIQSLPTLKMYYLRLQDTVLRRVWAERAAVPVCSRYVQSLIELLASVRRASRLSPSLIWPQLKVDAATPLPFDLQPLNTEAGTAYELSSSWEWNEGWVENDSGWEVWVGSVECMAVDWKQPSRSAARSLMDGGEGPPMLRESCTVLRGVDWEDEASGSRSGDEDGKKSYEAEKAEREKEKKSLEDQAAEDPAQAEPENGDTSNDEQTDPASAENDDPTNADNSKKDSAKKKKRKRIPNPKLPIGTVLSIEPWDGLPAMARRIRWSLTGEEGIYRYGGDGGRFDICHVDVNEKATRVKKKHPLPESAEQCAARHGFGSGKRFSVILRFRRRGKEIDGGSNGIEWEHQGVLEWPDFGAGVYVTCIQYPDGAILIKENDLAFGSKDSGWEARFGQASFVSGTEIMLSPTGSNSLEDTVELDTRSAFMSAHQELLGSTSYVAKNLRNRSDGSKVRVTLEMRILRGRGTGRSVELIPQIENTVRPPPPLCFDRDYHASSMTLSRDGRTVTCISPDGRGTAFASVGFTKGVHYWEVKLEQADIGSVFIGVAEKPSSSGLGNTSGHDGPPRLNRWLGWGFVNFRATYTAGAERVYGAHCHNEDTVGVLLDCDAGRLSFFYDGLKYGEHILNDLGCAFENISPFGFNADGCGSGGAGQGAPSGIEGGRAGRYPAHGVVRPRSLWPVIGLRNPGDRVTLSPKWSTSYGIDSAAVIRNVLAVEELMTEYCNGTTPKTSFPLPDWFVKEAFEEYRRWHSDRWLTSTTRCSGSYRMTAFGMDVELDRSPLACAVACAAIGLRQVLLPGDRVAVKRSAGRPLELAEEAVILGSNQCRLFYRIVTQKSEGGSLTEGGGRAWFWDESEVVGESLQLVGAGRGAGIELPLINRFRCLATGGLKVVYEGGAVVRSDLEIFDRSSNLGTIPNGTIIPRDDVLERRVNSCGVIRYRVRYESIGEGWISSRIRGGKEEAIVEAVHDAAKKISETAFQNPEEAALLWFKHFEESRDEKAHPSNDFLVEDVSDFKRLIEEGILSDSVVADLVNVIADFSDEGSGMDCTFHETLSAVTFATSSAKESRLTSAVSSTGANHAAASVLNRCGDSVPSPQSLLARISVLRALNRRLRRALPWLSVRPSQEGTAILGGLCGHGSPVDRAGRTKLTESMQLWVQVPCIASRLRSIRGLIFTSVKNEFLESVVNATTTPTPLSHDEYELPREIRTVRVNRLKARRAMAGDEIRLKRKHSVFAQLQNETRNWGGAALRRGFVAKGHGGQKRAFKVKLIGEGVNDYSGPYREVFTDAFGEVLEYDHDGHGALGVLDPSPNNYSQVGDDRGLFMFARGERDLSERIELVDGVCSEERRIRKSFSSLTTARDESSREVEESLVFLGRLLGTACRHGIQVDLPLALTTVWKAITEEPIEDEDALREIDLLASRHREDGEESALLWWQQRMLNSFVDGMSHLLPVELLPLLSAKELRAMLCGNPDVDVDLLKRVTEYEGYSEADPVIQYFWEALREMNNSERRKFLQFVWARSRLPNRESDFDSPFKIQRDSGGNDVLPSASTCFFSLSLPEYSSKEVLREKLTFAFENVCTMESDYVTNDAEVGEGWRGL